jgi:hypothetical protein
MDSVHRLAATLGRLRTHLESIKNGSLGAEEDLSVVLHLLIGEGSGYSQVEQAFNQLNLPGPLLPVWPESNLPLAEGGKQTILDIRTTAHERNRSASLNEFLAQKCLRYSPSANGDGLDWSWSKVVEVARHNYGAHGAARPTPLLNQIRYYPTAGADVLTLLLWSLGEMLLDVISNKLVESGVNIQPYQANPALNNVQFERGRLLKTPTGGLLADAVILLTAAPANNIAIVTGMFSGKPVLLGLNPSRQPIVRYGESGTTFDQLLEAI